MTVSALARDPRNQILLLARMRPMPGQLPAIAKLAQPLPDGMR